MKLIFADTSFLVACYNRKDANHEKAKKFVSEIHDKYLFVISDYIFDEVLTVVLARSGKSLSVQTGQRILEDDSIHILQMNEDVFQKAWAVYQEFNDKMWSFTDCTSYVLMKNLSINTGASFDQHFRQFGFKTVP